MAHRASLVALLLGFTTVLVACSGDVSIAQSSGSGSGSGGAGTGGSTGDVFPGSGGSTGDVVPNPTGTGGGGPACFQGSDHLQLDLQMYTGQVFGCEHAPQSGSGDISFNASVVSN